MTRKFFEVQCSELMNCTVYRNCDKEPFVMKGAVPANVHETDFFKNEKFRQDLHKYIPRSPEMQFLLMHHRNGISWVTQQSFIKHYTLCPDQQKAKELMAHEGTTVIWSEQTDPENYGEFLEGLDGTN